MRSKIGQLSAFYTDIYSIKCTVASTSRSIVTALGRVMTATGVPRDVCLSAECYWRGSGYRSIFYYTEGGKQCIFMILLSVYCSNIVLKLYPSSIITLLQFCNSLFKGIHCTDHCWVQIATVYLKA
jgi:hypothetical protein